MTPRFVLKWKMKGRPNRARQDESVERGRLLVGSRPLADIYVTDRMVAQQAAALVFDGASVSVETLDEFTGVYVDGRAVDGRTSVPENAVVQVGHTLIEIDVDVGEGVCTVTTNEQHLSSAVDALVRKAKPPRPFRLVESGPQEHRWGRSPVLRCSVLIACALGLGAFASVPFLIDTEWQSRGELAWHHRIGAHAQGPASCADCHDPLADDYTPKCAACHEGYDDVQFHPFGRAADTPCNECHEDHRGANADLIPVRDAPGEDGWSEFCLGCHGVLEPGASGERSARDRAGEPRTRALVVDGFSHREHRIAEQRSRVRRGPAAAPDGAFPVECSACHAARVIDLRSDPAGSDFKIVDYEGCLECHADWAVPVHGRDDNGSACADCHARSGPPDHVGVDLRSVDLPATGRMWSVPPRRHDMSNDECRTCHVRDITPDRRTDTPVELAFRHDHHLKGVASPGTGLVFSEQCVACHPAVAKSESLAGVEIVDTSSCGECHSGGDPRPLPGNGTRTVVDMFHSLHTVDPTDAMTGARRSLAEREKLLSGCLSCHVPEADTGRVSFRPGTRDCTACHTRHANVGAGRCVLCHVDREFEGNRGKDGRLLFVYSELGPFERSKAARKTTAALPGFGHTSAGHADVPCGDCHTKAAVDEADRVTSVLWPAYDHAACVQCHALRRFHR